MTNVSFRSELHNTIRRYNQLDIASPVCLQPYHDGFLPNFRKAKGCSLVLTLYPPVIPMANTELSLPHAVLSIPISLLCDDLAKWNRKNDRGEGLVVLLCPTQISWCFCWLCFRRCYRHSKNSMRCTERYDPCLHTDIGLHNSDLNMVNGSEGSQMHPKSTLF